MSEVAPIATMPLYTNVDRIAKGLAALGIGPTDPIQPEQLFAMDQWHYHGTDAIRDTAKRLGLGPTDRVLDVGSGVGGPARWLAHTIGCHVTALELQPELNEIAIDLTRRCSLDRLVTHVCADALTYPLAEASFDAWVSWLAILHIPDRPRLLARLRQALRPGGRCHIEDLCMRATFAPRDLNAVRQIVHGNVVTTIADYKADLESSGLHRCRRDGSHARLGALCRRTPDSMESRSRCLRARARRSRLRGARPLLHGHRPALRKRQPRWRPPASEGTLAARP